VNVKSSGHRKLTFLIGFLVIAIFVVLITYCVNLKSTNKETGYNKDYIIFQGKKVSIGDKFNFSPSDNCVEDTEATLDTITGDSVTLKIKEWNWKNELNTSIEETVNYVIYDKDCITARSVCMDVGYKYCFSLSVVDSVQNITYELKSYSTMPKPPFL